MSIPVVATNMSLGFWCHQSYTKSTRFVQKIEMCTASCAGDNVWATPISKNHHHTFLRVSLEPDRSCSDASANTLLIECVLSTDGACHSVTPMTETLPTSDAPSHPEIHDRICAIDCGLSTALAHHLVVERTLTFDGCAAECRISLAQLADPQLLVEQ